MANWWNEEFFHIYDTSKGDSVPELYDGNISPLGSGWSAALATISEGIVSGLGVNSSKSFALKLLASPVGSVGLGNFSLRNC